MARWMRRPATVVAVAVAAGVAAGVGWATIPDGNGTINACYASSDKSLRVVAAPACASGETAVNWSQSGVQGLQGPQGPQGPEGKNGAQGSAGVRLVTLVGGQAFADPKIGGFFKELTCPTGTKALQGSWSWDFFSGSMPPADVESFPIGDDSWGFAVGASSQSAGLDMFLGLSCVHAG